MQKFFTGDVVRYVGKSRGWAKKAEHIIHVADYRGSGSFEYSTTNGAWFTDKEFELIRRADKNSFKLLDKALLEEEEEDYE